MLTRAERYQEYSYADYCIFQGVSLECSRIIAIHEYFFTGLILSVSARKLREYSVVSARKLREYSVVSARIVSCLRE